MSRVDREKLLAAFETIHPGLSPNRLLEQSDCFILKNGKAYTFNDEVFCRAPTGLDKTVVGAIPANMTINLLKKLPDDELDVALIGQELVFTAKKRRAGLRLEADIILPINSIEKPKEWIKLPDGFDNALETVQQCASQDQTRFDLTCVHITPDYLEAADVSQVCRWKIKTGLSAPVLVRKLAIKPITQLGMDEFSETENWIHFRNQNGLMYSCRRYLEEFPDLGPILEVSGEPAKLPKGLIEAAERAKIFSSDNIEGNDDVLITLSPGKVCIKGQGVRGWMQETRNIKYSGRSLTFLIHPNLLIELVKQHEDCEISTDRLKVDRGHWRYVACLAAPVEEKTE